MLGTFMAALDNSIVNVSLPIMQRQFGVHACVLHLYAIDQLAKKQDRVICYVCK